MRLSLSWKFFLLISLTFFLFTIFAITQNEKVLTKTFDLKQKDRFKQLQLDLSSQIQKTEQYHLLIAQSFAMFKQTSTLDVAVDELLENKGVEWFVDWKLRSPSVVRSESDKIWNSEALQKTLKNSFRETAATAEANSVIFCESDCWILTTSLAGEKLEKTYTLGSSLIEVLIQNELLIALVKAPQLKNNSSSSNLNPNYIAEKDAVIWAMADLEKNRELVKKSFTEKSSLIEYEKKFYAIKKLSLPINAYGNELELYLLQDRTSDIETLEQLNSSHLKIAIIIWLVVQLFLIMIFQFYLKRLNTVSKVLPLILTGKFDSVFKSLTNKKTFLADEISDLERTVLEINTSSKKMLEDNDKYISRLEWQKLHNKDSGLPNWVSLEAYLEQTKNIPKLFILTKIVQFEAINNSIGISSGKLLVLQLVSQLEHIQSKTVNVYHIAGDEFILVITNVNEDNVKYLSKQYLSFINGEYELEVGNVISFDGRISSYFFNACIQEELEKIYQKLSVVMNHNELKEQKVVVYDESKNYLEVFQEETLISRKIIRALDDDRLFLVFQPIWDVEEKNISHYEVLCRIMEENGSILFPDAFIPIAEKYYLISKIGMVVLEKSLVKLKSEIKQNPRLRFSINVSTNSIQEESFASDVSKLLLKHDVKAEHIMFEVTEYSIIDNIEKAKGNLSKLSQLGLSIALDDFGTGYTSISYLRSMNLNYVKLDGSYVKNVLKNETNKNLVRSLIRLIHTFGLKCIAEYVEDQDITNFLIEEKVECLQGYFIGKPLSDLLDKDFSPF